MYRYADAEMGTPLQNFRPLSRHPTPSPPRPSAPKYGYGEWARLPLDGMWWPAGNCPYRSQRPRPVGSGSGDRVFDERWEALEVPLKRLVWQVSAYGMALNHRASGQEHIITLEAALTVCFAVWTGGQVREVPRHWQSGAWNLQRNEADILTRLLSKMAFTADFCDPDRQGFLLAQIDALLAALQSSSTLQNTVFDIIHHATSSCYDSWTLMFNDIDLAVRMHAIGTATQNPAAATQSIRELAVGLMQLDVVRRHARAYWQEHQDLDQIEVALRFEVVLQRRLNLPVVSRNWHFADRYWIPEDTVSAAQEAAHRAVTRPSAIDQFLTQWEPWKLHMRQLEVNHFAYNRLPERLWQGDPTPLQKLLCVITQEALHALKQPVFLGAPPHLRVFEHDALLTWWCQDGRDPLTREPLDLTELYRLHS